MSYLIRSNESTRLVDRVAEFLCRIQGDQDGNILIITGLFVVPIILFGTAFVLSYVNAERLQSQINVAAEEAVLMAVSRQTLNHAQYNSQNGLIDVGQIASQEIESFAGNFSGGGAQGSNVIETAAQYKDVDNNWNYHHVYGTTDTESFNYAYDQYHPSSDLVNVVSTATFTQSTSSSGSKIYTATLKWQANTVTFWSSILKMNSLPISGVSTASSAASPFLNIYLMLDNSPSMLIPSTSAGLTELYNASAINLSSWAIPDPSQITSNGTLGCDFACHTQHPELDNPPFVITDSNNKRVFLPDPNKPSLYYRAQDYDPTKNTSGGVYDINGSWMGGFRYCKDMSNAQNYAIIQYDSTHATGGSPCIKTTNPSYGPGLWQYQISGYWADSYWLAHNYTTLYPTGQNIDLRIDDENSAVQSLVPYMYSASQANGVTYGVQLSAFNWTHSGNSTPVVTYAPFNTMTALTSSNSTGSDIPNLGDLIYQDYYYSNGNFTQNDGLGDQSTDFYDMLTYMYNTQFANFDSTYNGISSKYPQNIMIIITDGMVDENKNGNRYMGPLSSDELNLCTDIKKKKNVQIAILYTQYLPNSLPKNFVVNTTNVQALLEQGSDPTTDQIEQALIQCASPGLEMRVTSDGDISAALKAIFDNVSQPVRLTQ